MTVKGTYTVTCQGEIAAMLYTMPFGDHEYLITHVWTNPHNMGTGSHRGHGHADQLLDQITADADDENANLILSVGDGSADMDPERLAGLYKRHGFHFDDAYGGQTEGAMSRQPHDKTLPQLPELNDCDDITQAVANNPLDQRTRSHIIQKAFQLGCTDNIPDAWSMRFKIEEQ